MIANKIKIKILVLALLLLGTLVFAQNVEFKSSNFKRNKSEFKLAKENIEIGDNVRKEAVKKMLEMQDVDEEYNKALFYYNKAQDFNPNNAALNYKIGSCLLFTNYKEEAFSYLERAKELSEDLPDDFLFYYAMSLQLESEYGKAREEFERFNKTAKKKVREKFEVLSKKYIEECLNAPEVLSIKKRIWVDNMALNTKHDEWSPCLSADGEFLIFTSNRPNENEANNIGFYDQEMYFSNKNGRNFSSVSSLSELNTIYNDVSGGLSYDGQRLLVFKNDDGNTDVYESILEGKKWGMPKRKMGEKSKGGNTDDNETFASYDPPDVKVYYITDGGYSGNKNIYFSGVMNRERNIWGKGQSAGHEINTKFQEGSVYIHPDGRTMYFSSKGHNTLGGYDIFVSYVDELGHWGKPINLGYPINTPYDDLFYSATASGRFAYIASNRAGGKGGLDIYKVTYWGADKPMTLDFEDQLISKIASPVSDNTVAEPIFVEEKSLTVFKGKILDAVTKKPIGSDIVITINSTGKVYTSCYSNSATGKFLLSLPAGENYGISVSADGYLFHSENFDLPKDDGFNMVNKDIELKNIKVGSNITLKNVFFETGKWDIKSDSYPELERLVALLKEVPLLKIEISGHTDNVGSDSFNELLSQKRADAVVNFLSKKGVSKERLIAKGYGKSKPVVTNDTEEGRAQNRRTEFEIIEN